MPKTQPRFDPGRNYTLEQGKESAERWIRELADYVKNSKGPVMFESVVADLFLLAEYQIAFMNEVYKAMGKDNGKK